MHLIRKELSRTQDEWNSHLMRPTKNLETPPGHPDALYLMPEILGIAIANNGTVNKRMWKPILPIAIDCESTLSIDIMQIVMANIQ